MNPAEPILGPSRDAEVHHDPVVFLSVLADRLRGLFFVVVLETGESEHPKHRVKQADRPKPLDCHVGSASHGSVLNEFHNIQGSEGPAIEPPHSQQTSIRVR